MHAIAVNEYGASPALVELPEPQLGSRQILIKVRTVGFLDATEGGEPQDRGGYSMYVRT